jgi:RNA polymerase sigma-70 factor (ECF subfamily)
VPVLTSDTRPRGGPLDATELERDQLLVARCQEGDADAFASLYELHYDRLVRFCRRRLASRHLAEDAAQDAFVRAWRAIDTLEPGSSFYPWLSVIAANRCTDLVRKERRARPVADLPSPRGQPSGDAVADVVVRREDAAVAGAAIRRLSPRHQRVLHLREELGLSVAEIAAVEGASPNATDTLLWRARAALQREFRALVDGAAGLAVVFGIRMGHVGRRVLHPLARTADSGAGAGPVPWAPIAVAASLSVAGGVLAVHAAAPSPAQPVPAVSTPASPAGGPAAGHGTGGGRPGTGADAGTPSAGGTAAGSAGEGAPGSASGGGASGGAGGTPAGGQPPGAAGAAGQAARSVGSLATSAANTLGGTVAGVGGTAGSAVGGVAKTTTGLVNGLTPPLAGPLGSSTGGSTGSAGVLPPVTGTASSTTSDVGSAVSGVTGALGGALQQTGTGVAKPGLP